MTPPATPNAAFDVPPFAQACKEAAGSAWGASFDHPFVLAIADGTLPADRFRFYQMQDARYLESFSDAAASISLRCPDPVDKLWFIDAARLALVVEGDLHAGYGRKLGYTPADVAAVELGPVTRAYRDHMVAAAQGGSLVEAIAALTPCPWLYTDLGEYLLGRIGTIAEDHPYADWLALYSSADFGDYMQRLLALLQRAAEAADGSARERALEAFHTSARLEWMFWEQAWQLEAWPV